MFKGSFPALVTPFKNGALDLATLKRLVEWHIAQGSHGLVPVGTTGESPTLSHAEHRQVVEEVVRTVAGRIPVIAGAGSNNTAEGIDLIRHAEKVGANAALVVTPYYIRPPQRGLVQYYLTLAAQHEVPWMIYHIPGRAAVNVTLESMKQIREQSPHFVGMKHAVNDLGFVSECLGAFGDEFKIFVGLEELSFPMMAIGACGLMNAVGNLRPGVLAQMCDAVWKGDMATGRALHQRLLEINQAVFFDTNPIPMKYMMKKLGLLTSNEHRLPMVPATPELEKRLDGVLERAGLLNVAT